MGRRIWEWYVCDREQCWEELYRLWAGSELQVHLQHSSWKLETREGGDKLTTGGNQNEPSTN